MKKLLEVCFPRFQTYPKVLLLLICRNLAFWIAEIVTASCGRNEEGIGIHSIK